MATKRRLDSERRTLRKGESQRTDGTYDYRWTTTSGERRSIYAPTLEALREKEEALQRDKSDGIKVEAKNVTINDMFDLWCDVKRGLKDNTFQNYKYFYNQFIEPDFGKRRIQSVKRTDVRRFYNLLVDERGLKLNTVDSIHTVLHQVLDMAVGDNYIRSNPSDNALKELKQVRNIGTDKRRALTVDQQKLFITFLKGSKVYGHWYPIFAVMLGTGMRVGEVTGLRWSDVDFEAEEVDVTHTLVYYNHSENGCYFTVNTPKTEAGERNIPMLDFVKEAFEQERINQKFQGIKCEVTIDGYTDFIFLNRNGNVQHQGTLNKALRRIIRDCNEEVIAKDEENPVLLPRFSCHNLRHTFTTRLCESGMNIKAIQEILGHKDISTTMDIYAEATKDLKKREMNNMQLKNSDIWHV